MIERLLLDFVTTTTVIKTITHQTTVQIAFMQSTRDGIRKTKIQGRNEM